MNNKNKRPTQVARVLEYMQKYGAIDQVSALAELGVMRLASRISELRKRGYDIVKTMRSGKNRYSETY